MIYMQTGKWIFFENSFSYLMHFLKRHFLISCILYCRDFFIINDIGTYLPQENLMRPDIRL